MTVVSILLEMSFRSRGPGFDGSHYPELEQNGPILFSQNETGVRLLKSMLPFRVEKQVIPTRNSAMNTRKPSVQIHSLKGTKNALCSRGCGKRKHKGMCGSRKVFRYSKGHSLCDNAEQEDKPVQSTLVRMERSNQIKFQYGRVVPQVCRRKKKEKGT